MAISSNALFHYTDKMSTIESILKEGFLLSLCKESIFAIPMVSFCDIPISNAKYYFDNYGSYGIGMNLDWEIRNKLNPVLYIESNSYLSDKFDAGIEAGAQLYDEHIPDSILGKYNIITHLVIESHRYAKPFKGDLIRKGQLIEKDYKFYNEREWRYIPDIDNDYFPYGLIGEEYEEFNEENPIKPSFQRTWTEI